MYVEIVTNRDAYVVNRLILITDDLGTVIINELITNSNKFLLPPGNSISEMYPLRT